MASSRGQDVGLPVGTVTFLLTDIESSSQAWESDAGAMAKAVARHYEILDEAIARHGGARPEEQGEGDSVVAVFTRAADAAACALDVQRAMTEEEWPHGRAIRLRIGLHTGDARLRDKGNYFGEAVVRCARLRGLAHGGQVLVSRATEELIVDQLPTAASLRDLGLHRLKDLARPEHVFQLCHAELQDSFPPLQSLDAVPNNLPLQLTSFIGRADDIAMVRALMSESRLVTLTGAGGCGKTRLALQVAAEALETKSDGAWWIDLARLADPDLVPSAVAATLSVREVQDQALMATLVQRLRSHHALIVLDNCEHLIGACAEVTEALVHGCPELSILATSREPLGVEGEVSWRVPSLALPSESGRGQIESLSQCDSVRLFIDRAVRARPNFAVTSENAPAVAEICHRLDGIPLALELAAARVRLLTPDQIVVGLADRFRLLTGGRRSALPRQRTLEASVDWSYNLLSEDERTMLRRLSVFAGGFTLDAAEEVCADGEIAQVHVLDLLSSLVDRSLVQVEEGGADGRYRLLETIRVYSRQKLADAGEAAVVRDHHLTYFVSFVERVAPKLEGSEQLTWLERIETDIDNLRAAMDWASESNHSDESLRLAASMTRYWIFRNRLTEAESRLGEALATEAGAPQLRARALAWRAYINAERIEIQLANEVAEQALLAGRSDPEVVALAVYAQALGAVFAGSGDERRLLDESIAAAQAAELPSVLARSLSTLAMHETRIGNRAKGDELFDEALAAAHRSGDRFALLIVRIWMGVSDAFRGDVAAGRANWRAALELAREFDSRIWIALALSYLAYLETIAGDTDTARELGEEALSIATDAANPVQIAVGHIMGSGTTEYAIGNFQAAVSHFDPGIEIGREMGFTLAVANGLPRRALTSLITGDLNSARMYAEEGEAVARRIEYPEMLSVSLHCLAGVALAEKDVERAEELEHEALAEARRADRKPGIVDSLEALSRIAAALESDQEATRLVAAAQRIRSDISYVRFPIHRPRHNELLDELRERLGDEAFESAWAEGAALDLDAAVAYAERGRGERKRPSSGWGSLTPTELDVVRLAAQGLTNPQIAERLFVTRATVKSHLGHIFAKLGVATRAELAAEATRRAV